jgi:hypothetical protein
MLARHTAPAEAQGECSAPGPFLDASARRRVRAPSGHVPVALLVPLGERQQNSGVGALRRNPRFIREGLAGHGGEAARRNSTSSLGKRACWSARDKEGVRFRRVRDFKRTTVAIAVGVIVVALLLLLSFMSICLVVAAVAVGGGGGGL